MGNPLNWNQIVEDFGPRLYRYFCVRFSPEQADDLTQETLLRLVRKVDEGYFDPEKGSLHMLGFGIAHYVALEAKPPLAHESLDDWESKATSTEDLELTTMQKQTASKVRDQMTSLSTVEQQVLALFVDEELSIKEASVILQLPQGTVKSHIHRAKRKLISSIQTEGLL